MSVQIGKPNKGGAYKKKNYFYIGQGVQAYRILPALGNLASQGIWSKYYEVHFGYKNLQGKMRPFQSCEVRNQKNRQMIEVDDPAAELIKTLEGQLKAIKDRMNTNPSDELAKKMAELEALVGFKGTLKLEKRHYVNAINDKGEIGLLQLKHKEMLAVKEARKTIEAKYGIDPIDVEGAFLEFKKSGKGLDTLVSVDVQRVVQSDKSEKANFHTLDDALISRLSKEAFELDSLYVALSREEIQSIVDGRAAGKEAEAVSAVFSAYDKNTTVQETEQTEIVEETAMETKVEVKAETKAPAKKVETKAEVKAEPKVEVKKAAAVSDDDFLASIGVKN